MKYMDLVKLVKGTHGAAYIASHTVNDKFITARVFFSSPDWSEDTNLDNLLDTLYHDCIGYQFIKGGWVFDCGEHLGVYLIEEKG